MQTYGLVASRNLIMAEREMLKRAEPIKVISSFGMNKEMPQNKTDTIVFRRALPVDAATTGAASGAPQVTASDYLLQEGVTPSARTITYQDVQTTLQEYGILMKLSSKAELTYEDDIPKDMVALVGEHMGTLEEMICFNAVRGGTNIIYADGSARSSVQSVISLNKLRQAARNLEAAHGKHVTKKLAPGPNFGTAGVSPGYLVFSHTDLEADVRNLPGFTPKVEYGSGSQVHDREVGAVEQFRFITSPYFRPWAASGASVSTGVLRNNGQTTGTANADVYPVLIVAEDAWGSVALKGMGAIKPIYLPAKQVNHANPLGRFGYVGAQFMKTALRLNEQWMVRYEVAASVL